MMMWNNGAGGRGLTTTRRLPVMFAFVAVVAGCSSGSSTVATSTSSTSLPTSSAVSPTSSAVAAGGATDFCGAFRELTAASGATSAAAVGAAYQSAAADMRTYAPPAIKDAAMTYADMMDTIGKAAQSGTMDQQALHNAVAQGMAGKSADISQVAVWVGTNCHL
jgi:hypothetical protein